MRKHLLLFFLLLGGAAQAQEFMFQGWYWDYPYSVGGQTWAEVLDDKASELGQAGFTHIWVPPMSRGTAGTFSMGYDPQDLFDLGGVRGRTRFGRRSHIDDMIQSLRQARIQVIGDLVYNHRDGGLPEPNPAVEGWIENFDANKVNAGDQPFPNDRYRCILPIGGNTGRGAGDYYFKIRSASRHSNFYGRSYGIYMSTSRVGSGAPAQSEMEPNGGGDCGEAFNTISLGGLLTASVDAGGCGTDEFKLTLDPGDFDPNGDFIYITLTNQNVSGYTDYSDHYIYGIWDAANSQDVQGDLIFETYTDFTQMPSGRGGMNWTNFKPNGNPTQLSGDYDGMWFFFDYDQNQPATRDTLFAWTKWMFQSVGIGGIRADAVKHFSPTFMGDLMDYLHDEGIDPGLVVGELFDSNGGTLRWWVDEVHNQMDPDTRNAITVRVFDFSLRQALRDACDAFGFDARNVFNASLVDQGTDPFRVVTFTDNHDFDNEGHTIYNDPILAYAYILTNNQIGVPTVFYKDYYEPAYLQGPINGLMQVHQKYIFGANSRDYLNRFSTPYASSYLQGQPNTSLIYQLQGSVSGRQVIVAINFAGEPLKVDHEINMGGLSQGTEFTDIFGISPFDKAVVNGSNQVYLEVPARSFGVWVQGGDLTDSLLSLTTSLEARPLSESRKVKLWQENEQLHVSFQASSPTPATVFLYDLQGRSILQRNWQLSPGGAARQISTASLAKGLYIVRVEVQGKAFFKKLLLE